MRIPALFALLLTAATAARAGDVRFAGDSTPWHVASDETSGGVRTLELLRPGRNFGNSPEILTIARFAGDDASTAAEEYLSEKRGACDDGHYEFARSSWDDTVYSWEPRGCDAPDAELDEVGRVFVAGSEVIRISLRLRDGGRLGYWEDWIGSANAAYRTWSGSVFASGGRRASSPPPPDFASCADDDVDCMVALQKQGLRSMQIDPGTGSRSGSAHRGGGVRRGGSSPGSNGCCAVSEIRSLVMQRDNPVSGRSGDVTRFLSTDTYIYVIADLRGNQGGSTVTFRWVKLDADGDENAVTSHDVTIESGNTWVYGSFYYNGLTPIGRYRVHVYFDGVYAGSREFQVVAGSHFG